MGRSAHTKESFGYAKLCDRVFPPPGPLPRAGHYPQVVPLDAAAVWAEWEDRCLAVPKGQTAIAQRFNAGFPSWKETSPVRDDRRCFDSGISLELGVCDLVFCTSAPRSSRLESALILNGANSFRADSRPLLRGLGTGSIYVRTRSQTGQLALRSRPPDPR